jgi:radical SAM superfamily enzyme YgiQ (UPF0313 family)
MKKSANPKSVAFYISYEKYGRDDAPAILQFIQYLRYLGHKVDLFISEKELLENVKDRYDVVALSVLSSVELEEILVTAVRVKKIDPCAVVVLGGHGVDGNAVAISNATGVDVVVEGEGELVFPMLLEHLERAENEEDLVLALDGKLEMDEGNLSESIRLLAENRYISPITEEQVNSILGSHFTREVRGVEVYVPIQGVVVNSSAGKFVITGREKEAYEKSKKAWEEKHSRFPLKYQEFIRHVHPYPSNSELRDIPLDFPWEDIKERGWQGLSLYVQRGCNWGKCSYCGINTPYGRRYPVEDVLQVLKKAAENNITKVAFDDDQFVQNRRWVEELLDGIIREGLNKELSFGAMVRVDALADPSLIQKLGEANFGRLQIGVESFIPQKIRYFKKTARGREEEYTREAKKLIFRCLREGIVPGVFIITTRPKKKKALLEVSEELLTISNLIKEASRYQLLPIFSFSDILMAYPGSPLLQEEKFKKMLVPLRAITEDGKIKIESLEIPYIFDFKSMALANFIGIHKQISSRRKVPSEVLNETWEHIDDLCQALEIAARHLDTPVGVVLEFLSEIDELPSANVKALFQELERETSKKIGSNSSMIKKMIVRREIQPDLVLRAVDRAGDSHMKRRIEELKNELRKEKEEVLDKCRRTMENLRATVRPIHQELKEYLAKTKEELAEIGETKQKDNVRARLDEIRRRTRRYMDRIYPYLTGRNTLEALLNWIDEFENQNLT